MYNQLLCMQMLNISNNLLFVSKQVHGKETPLEQWLLLRWEGGEIG